MKVPIWSDLERMVMFDIYYQNKEEDHWPHVKFDEYENTFYQDQTVRMIYSYSYWDQRLGDCA